MNEEEKKKRAMALSKLQGETLTLQERETLLFPELFAPRMETSTPIGGVVGSNDLGTAAGTLWSGVASKFLETYSTLVLPVQEFTTDFSNIGINAPAGTTVTVNVEVVDGAGSAMENATNWEQSALETHYVKVDMVRLSRSFGLTSYDLMRGERIETKLGAAIQSVAEGIMTKLGEALKAQTIAAVEISPSGGTPPYQWGEAIARTVSPVFGDRGGVDYLLVSPDVYAQLIPVNALSLGTQPGTYGIGRILNVPKMSTYSTGGAAVAIAGRKDAIIAAAGTPDLSALQGLSVRSLGTIGGVPLLLKSWINPGVEQVFCSVETLIGFKVALPSDLRLVKVKAAASSGSGSSGGGASQG